MKDYIYGPRVLVSSLTNRPVEGNEAISPSFFCTACNVKFLQPAQALEHFLRGKAHLHDSMVGFAKKPIVSIFLSLFIIILGESIKGTAV